MSWSQCALGGLALGVVTAAVNRLSKVACEIKPVQCVIVGGGYSGARAAYQLDSVLRVTLIDDKNYLEATEELYPALCGPWGEETDQLLEDVHVIHRFYLHHARVVTGRVVDMDENTVKLRDGTCIPYDVLILSTGERRPFPWSPGPGVRTAAERAEELRHFGEFIRTECKKIAVVGGGPRGVATAMQLVSSNPELEVDLFHSNYALLPQLPRTTQEYTTQALTSPTVPLQVYLNTCVDGITQRKGKFDLNCTEHEAPEMTGPPSVFQQLLLHVSPTSNQPLSKDLPVISNRTEGPYDYVFNCTGSIPHSASLRSSAFLAPHLASDSRLIISSYLQLLGHPNVFALGRSTHVPWVSSVGASDVVARTLFRNLLGVVTAKQTFARSMNGGAIGTPVDSQRMGFPRLIVPLGPHGAAGSSAWTGSVTGASAIKELGQDRQRFFRDFANPRFFKQRDDGTVRSGFDQWRERAFTDIADFEL